MKNCKRDRHATETEVQKTLQSFDHIDKVKAKPFFFARLQRRLDALQTQKRAPHMFKNFLWPALAPLLVVCSIGTGIWIGYKPVTSDRTTATTALIETYGLKTPDLTEYTLMGKE